jgi:hypothetical protein
MYNKPTNAMLAKQFTGSTYKVAKPENKNRKVEGTSKFILKRSSLFVCNTKVISGKPPKIKIPYKMSKVLPIWSVRVTVKSATKFMTECN